MNQRFITHNILQKHSDVKTQFGRLRETIHPSTETQIAKSDRHFIQNVTTHVSK